MKKLFIQVIYFYVFQFTGTIQSDIPATPNFSAPIANTTVPVGREAVLTCVVHDLVSYKVAWLRVDTQTILTIQNHVITKNHRIGITHTENRIWQLRIRDVKQMDRGWYMCQINTDPMKSQLGYLDIVVPPDILDAETSHDMIVQEKQNVTLHCAASGSPEPFIEWRREDGKAMFVVNNTEAFSEKGSILQLAFIKRQQMGSYLCIASNGIPPSVSKRIVVIVNFPPVIWARQESVYVAIGQKTIIECVSESNPKSVNYWLHDKEIISGGLYEPNIIGNVYKVVMKLTIRPVKTTDFGQYKCIVKNTFGEAEKTIHIHYKTKSMNLQQNNYQPASQLGNTIIQDDWTSSPDEYLSQASSFLISNTWFITAFSLTKNLMTYNIS